MKIKRISLLLVLAVCISLFAGCQSSELSSYTGDLAQEQEGAAAEQTGEEEVAEESTSKDYSAAYNTYPLNELMMTVSGIDVTWDELFYWYIYDVSNIEAYFGDITDWDAACYLNEAMSNREYVMKNAIDTVKHYCALESKARDMGVELNEVDKTMLEANWQQNVINYGNGDEQAFIDYLAEVYLSRDVYDHVNEVSALYQRVLAEMFGADGEKLGEQEIIEKATDMGYMRAKHILISTVDDTKTKLPEAQLKEKKAQAQAILTELSAISDAAALEARMDELIAAESEDPGAAYYKDGYTFLPGKMTAEFENAVSELDDYGLSEIVESEYGYHIVLRLPLSAAALVEYSSETEYKTLGYYVAQELFAAQTESWAQEVKIETTETYNAMDIAQVFTKAESKAES